MTLFDSKTIVLAVSLLLASVAQQASASGTHDDGDKAHGGASDMIEQMREQHGTHEHGHDFEAMEELSPNQLERMIGLMEDVGLVLPKMDPERGRKLFVDTGCVVCHSVNQVGGEIGPDLDAADMPSPMNAFEFSARMWRGAAAMTSMQDDLLGGVISLTGQDLADLVAFAHDEKEQGKLTADQIPEKFKAMLEN
jgi:mono/diheme cytochrome c family protein